MIEVQELYKYYGEKRALGPVEASIEKGEVIGLLGLNGAGKTTTLRILACDLLPTSGTVTVGGCDVVKQPDEVRAKVGYLPDRPPLYDEMSVREFLVYAARLRRVARGDVQRKVDRALEQTELGRVRNQLIATLSHGYRQRVGIAQAIVHEPELVVLDEPISGLDPAQIVEMRRLVRSLRGERTVVVSSHILGEISETCDRILVIRDGRIVAAGTESELVAREQGQRVDVLVRGADAQERASALIAEVDPEAKIEPLPSAEPEVVAFRVVTSGDRRAELSRALVGAGLDLVGLSRSARDLESVFLELSTDLERAGGDPDERDDAEGAAPAPGERSEVAVQEET
ncbi:MAG: ABC transporter ATP-binding protein [Myxococcales bacterium]|nr:ABC transporter ATP-binding protein [Myxococcales bacterium]